MNDTPRTNSLLASFRDIDHEDELVKLERLCCQLEREVNDLRTDAARYRAIRGLLAGGKWSDTPFFYSGACPPDEKYITVEGFGRMADRLCEDPQ